MTVKVDLGGTGPTVPLYMMPVRGLGAGLAVLQRWGLSSSSSARGVICGYTPSERARANRPLA